MKLCDAKSKRLLFRLLNKNIFFYTARAKSYKSSSECVLTHRPCQPRVEPVSV